MPVRFLPLQDITIPIWVPTVISWMSCPKPLIKSVCLSSLPSPLSEDGLYYEKDHLQLLSFFGRLNYSFMNRYLLTFTVRGDATSRFSKNNRWGVFPSVALAWKINEEAWMQGASGWLSDFKLHR